MTDDQLIALAEECGLGPILGGIRDADDMWLDCDVIGGLERFAALVAERTREECAIESALRLADAYETIINIKAY